MLTRISMLLLLGLWGGPVLAETEVLYNQVRFQVRAMESVANDHMQAVMVAQYEDDDPARLADRINKTMGWALAQTRNQSAIQVRTGGYTTQPVYKKEGISGWRATQELILTGADFTPLGKLIGTLQQQLQLRSVGFDVAAETREEMERALIDRALNGFKQRAEQVRANIGSKSYRIVELNIVTEDSPGRPIPMMRVEAMSKAVAAPSFEGGESEVRVAVHGVVQLE